MVTALLSILRTLGSLLVQVSKIPILLNDIRLLLIDVRTLLVRQGEKLDVLAEIKTLLQKSDDNQKLLILKADESLRVQEQLLDIGEQILERLDQSSPEPPEPAVKLTLHAVLEGETEEREVSLEMPLIQPVDKTSTWKATATDKFGNPATLDGALQFALADPNQGTFEVSADGLTAKLTPTGPVGDAQVQVTGDADLGAGVTPILGVGTVTLVAGAAVNLSVEGVLDEVAPPPPPPDEQPIP